MLYDIPIQTIDESETTLGEYAGKVLLIGANRGQSTIIDKS
jgi:glutathione peroxidase-family protein